MALASGNYDRTVRKMGVRVASEGFADRAYNVDLSLVSRKLPGSLITDPQKAADQAVRMALESKVKTIDGVDVDISVQTICCHGDTPGAQKIVEGGARGARPGRVPGQAAARLAALDAHRATEQAPRTPTAPPRAERGGRGALAAPQSDLDQAAHAPDRDRAREPLERQRAQILRVDDALDR